MPLLTSSDVAKEQLEQDAALGMVELSRKALLDEQRDVGLF